MVDTMVDTLVEETMMIRQLEKHWNGGLIAASIAISLLGAFTSTQLMCQARTSRHFSRVLVWAILASLTFGFCSIWCLHYVAILACELDLPIGINVPLTVLSALLAVVFTFTALTSDLLWDRYNRARNGRRSTKKKRRRRSASANRLCSNMMESDTAEPLLDCFEQEDAEDNEHRLDVELGSSSRPNGFPRLAIERDETAVLSNERRPDLRWKARTEIHAYSTEPSLLLSADNNTFPESPIKDLGHILELHTEQSEDTNSESWITESLRRASSDRSIARRLSSVTDSSSSKFGLSYILSNHSYRESSASARNALSAIYLGSNRRNMVKGFIWSLAITGMHYVGILALHIPKGYLKFNPILVALSGVISWFVCLTGCILMPQMEVHLLQQFLFSAVATCGVAAMHFTGMRAATFWSSEPPSESRGYPPILPIAIASIAITTCLTANALLAHSATVSRNKLVEIVSTRKKLWIALAQKETAESAAAARSEFIASASHEIRTPLHHLQGYSDLLSRTDLTQEGRLLLYAIQRATKTLSLITNNVLDWSRLERDGEAVCRPVALDIRTVCESVVTLLPNRDDEIEADLMVVVSPEVPYSIFIDETYIHRILMNLLSNALKFTSSGYILLLVELENDQLVATVKDTGPGVPPSFQPHLFEPYKQAHVRGAQRGTGLGLSIIKQLLHKMQGTIAVESRHQDTEGVEPGTTGSTFTVKIPVKLSSTAQDSPQTAKVAPKVAIFHSGNEQSLAGLCLAWEKFDFEVVMPKKFSDISGTDLKYVWADLPFLKQNPTVLQQPLEQDQWPVLVPYDSQDTLQEIPEISNASRFCPIPKPLIWHCIERNITASTKATHPRTVRFAPQVEIVDTDKKEESNEGSAVEKSVVLLVEDNPINRKLGVRILTTLGYHVLTAEDGEEAIQQVLKHEGTISAILMDQSMPRKDGLTATREIRAMEKAGRLSKRIPIIAVTAVVSSQARTLCKEAGTDDFLPKPLSMERLEQTLAAHLSSKRRRQDYILKVHESNYENVAPKLMQHRLEDLTT